ncbi:MAG: FecR family protein [Solidesulfovibrio sp. DCME]|uniref:FecR family protein n=1 Tax=Solidesulfovibrio sp. DCME TaxID=3447380 RepID=UPI003D0DFEC7
MPRPRPVRRVLGVLAGLVAGLAACLALFAAPARAAGPEQAGLVTAIEGQALATGRDGVRRALALESPVRVGDSLETGADGALQVTLQDGTAITMQASGRLEINDFLYKDQQPGAMAMAVTFLTGVCRLVTGEIVKHNPERYKVNSPYASIGIRGTEIGSRVTADGQLVALLSGSPITVTGKSGEARLIAQADFGVDAAKGAPLSAPRPLTEEEKRLFARRVFRSQMDSQRLQMLLQSNRPIFRPGRF